MCGHGMIAVVTMAIERGLIVPRAAATRSCSTRRRGRSARAPTVDAMAIGTRVDRVSFVQRAVVRPPRRRAGVDSAPRTIRGGRRVWRRVLRDRGRRVGRPCGPPGAADRTERVGHGDQARGRGRRDASCIRTSPSCTGIYGTIFTGPPSSDDAHLRNVTIFADAEVDRSPCGTGTCAVMAVLAAMGLLGPEQTFVHESIIGTRFRGRVDRRDDGWRAIRPSCRRSRAKPIITGENVFLIDERGPVAARVPALVFVALGTSRSLFARQFRRSRLGRVGPDERRRMVFDETLQVHLPHAGSAELALMQDREQQRREQRHRRVPQIDRRAFPPRATCSVSRCSTEASSGSSVACR